MISFGDIFKNKFLDTFTENAGDTFNIYTILFSFLVALILGLFIFFIYKYTFGGVMYSRSFNGSLFGLTIITTFVISAVTSNVVLSLGMVGALSIVRFRTAIKDPMDLVFLFWAIGTGIVTGAQIYALAIIGSVIIGAVIFLTSQRVSFDSAYLAIINCEIQTSESACIEIIKKHAKKARLKSKIVSAGKGTELIYEIRCKDDNTDFINELSAVEGVQNASLVSYNGEFLN
jgi:uncharacterized membrane protein YhiD involved in acid resistance